ncbi:hypothetical protein [Xanthomonas hortorum]|uniref:Uncharacterized protein n=2 Tax=Xanthomonas hortorum TaxID=56454 RepID=A0A6V7E886_9XANT|nr:hypothetical protein [Xanthomonas hortorum]EGD17757.1 hypothetical protein XGA_3640 [Xanthomonas hortorum ATCC 19865]MCC8498673.1 hypothetical protein [Xanthomonas hortorum pv. gardneri]MCC8507441.1 hypothetical protein [Xanthomonas hortorum pv. gardneri]MCC8511906.1 hypothetical protein [Xanthomonas hortorum pv. gardneri]MCC8520201.1 hypothetical protein [Xanthomonas hortorum pv. gardneri]
MFASLACTCQWAGIYPRRRRSSDDLCGYGHNRQRISEYSYSGNYRDSYSYSYSYRDSYSYSYSYSY